MENITGTQKGFAVLAHGAGLLGAVGFLIIPFIIWRVKKEDSFVAWHAKQALGFQLLCMAAVIVIMVVYILLFDDIETGVYIAVIIPSFVWFICAIFAVIKALSGELYIYPGLQFFTKKL